MSELSMLDTGDSVPVGLPRDVACLFERLALEVTDRGFKKYSARAILHRLRWHYHVEQGNRTFKINNVWSARLSRWFTAKHPRLAGFFEQRERRGQVCDDDE